MPFVLVKNHDTQPISSTPTYQTSNLGYLIEDIVADERVELVQSTLLFLADFHARLLPNAACRLARTAIRRLIL